MDVDLLLDSQSLVEWIKKDLGIDLINELKNIADDKDEFIL